MSIYKRRIEAEELYDRLSIGQNTFMYPLFISHLINDWGGGKWSNSESICEGLEFYIQMGSIPQEYRRVRRIQVDLYE